MINHTSPALGTLINQDFSVIPNLDSYTTATPDATFALSGGYLRITNEPGSGGFTNYIRYDGYGSTQLEKFDIECVVKPVDNDATSFGISIGIISTNTTSTVTFQGFLELDSGANKGKVRIYKNGSAIGSLSTALTWSIADRIKLTLNRNQFVYTLTATNLTSGTSTVSTSYTASQTVTSDTVNTVGKPCIWSNGGTQDIEYLQMKSASNKFPQVGFCSGDSITDGYSASPVSARWPEQSLVANNKPYTVSACPASKTAEILSCIEEMKIINPRYLVMMIGGNDVASGIAQATYEANYTSIRDQMSANGSMIIHCYATPRDAFDMTTLNNFIATFTSDSGIVNTFTPLKGVGTDLAVAYDSGDGTHPNTAGHALTGSTVSSAVPIIH